MTAPMFRTIAIAAAVLSATSAAALAHSNDARLSEQTSAIELGRTDGSITWREGRKLKKEQAEIARVRAGFEADGKLTKNEQRILHEMQTQSEAHIVAESNDGWRRWKLLPRVGY